MPTTPTRPEPGVGDILRGLADDAKELVRQQGELFRAEVGTSPGRYVEQARVDAARAVLEHERVGLATVARRCGFSSQERLIRTFHRSLGVTPGEYRSRYAAGDAGQTGP